MTNTQRSLKKLKDDGYDAAVTERWNSFAGIRQDLWGFADLIAFREGSVVLVQTTSYAAVSARRKKIMENEVARRWMACGFEIIVHGWRKVKNRWTCREVRLDLIND